MMRLTPKNGPGRCLLLTLAFVLLCSVGCRHGKYRENLVKSQLHARELYAENQRLIASGQQNQQMIQGLTYERQALMSQLGDTEMQLATANNRVENLMAERSQLTDRIARAINDSVNDGSGFAGALQLPGFEYDPSSGLNKYREDILFDLGSDAIRPEALPVISEFASTINSGSGKGMRVLIVGHTDDQNIVRPETAIKHPTNWHLSTDRADAVILELLKLGVEPARIAAMGYSEFHPLDHSRSDQGRQRNRRVELFVVPNEPHVAGWDPVNSLR